MNLKNTNYDWKSKPDCVVLLTLTNIISQIVLRRQWAASGN